MISVKKLLVIITSVLLLTACDKPESPKNDKKVSQAELNDFIKNIKTNLVFVDGGDFEMGDFGEKLYGGQIDPYPDSKPLHRVELTSYSMSKFKISNRDYHLFLDYHHRPVRDVRDALKDKWAEYNSTPETPARIDWYEAADYCAWLGKMTGLPFSLPTEAQWEYAARSRGQFMVLPTNTGKADIEFHSGGKDRGINISTSYDRKLFARKNNTHLEELSNVPGDAFPPNPLGIYDMTGNGFEWVSDWYDPDYYKNSPTKDLQGPEKPEFEYDGKGYQKVMRSSNSYNGITGSTVGRTFRSPRVPEDSIPPSQTARCVVNLSEPVEH
ncbi:formylglycine-generating enzyme family protein [Leclercia adecarboxylata]|uniref:formylglycine-generating enzyme family protein n=1 Tax=Leclercia adecarboxylata TaxID=83655 RepID=UPI0022B77A2A|nr:SUMF1/EgtB/PvdO family nonheme iron enzyme [Leclercia adecarboxylata]MCZ7841441.1 formylglycine-generating enzyme family protein [Leclercia adecarboxylata]